MRPVWTMIPEPVPALRVNDAFPYGTRGPAIFGVTKLGRAGPKVDPGE